MFLLAAHLRSVGWNGRTAIGSDATHVPNQNPQTPIQTQLPTQRRIPLCCQPLRSNNIISKPFSHTNALCRCDSAAQIPARTVCTSRFDWVPENEVEVEVEVEVEAEVEVEVEAEEIDATAGRDDATADAGEPEPGPPAPTANSTHTFNGKVTRAAESSDSWSLSLQSLSLSGACACAPSLSASDKESTSSTLEYTDPAQRAACALDTAPWAAVAANSALEFTVRADVSDSGNIVRREVSYPLTRAPPIDGDDGAGEFELAACKILSNAPNTARNRIRSSATCTGMDTGAIAIDAPPDGSERLALIRDMAETEAARPSDGAI
jgi:hypothetical protein